MATISFKEDVTVNDPKKAEEIAQALRQPRNNTIEPSQPDKLPENASEIWFNRCDK